MTARPPTTFDGARATVMGLGRFGGGVGVTRWLAAQGARVLVTDLEPADKLTKSLAEIDDLIHSGAVTPRLGEHNEDDFRRADVVIANPAVPKPWSNPYLDAATEAGVPITTEIRLLVERLPNRKRTIGVTGTAGKSTTAAMIAHALERLPQPNNPTPDPNAHGSQSVGSPPPQRPQRVWLGGNIGVSLLPRLHEITDNDWVVLELSSAQLYWLDSAAWSPHIAVVTNIAPNHLDWHADQNHYTRSKHTILRHQREPDTAIVHQSVAAWARGEARPPLRHDRVVSADARVNLPGDHNATNAALALATVEQATGHSTSAGALADFTGLPHRLHHAGQWGGRDVYNDSKCTTPEGAARAIESFDPSTVRLIAGGHDKQTDLAPMIEPAARCAAVYTIGATGPAIASSIKSAGGHAFECQTLDHAVTQACNDSHPGETILLSPGCASWDQFENYEQRGNHFVQLARAALEQRAAT